MGRGDADLSSSSYIAWFFFSLSQKLIDAEKQRDASEKVAITHITSHNESCSVVTSQM